MKIIQDATTYANERPWGARDIANIEGASVRLHWTDTPYIWHVNDGTEVFMVVAGTVDMKYKLNGSEQSVRLEANDIFVAESGDEHVAHPVGPARILVVEKAGSV